MSDTLDSSAEGLQTQFERLRIIAAYEDAIEEKLAKQGKLPERVELTDEEFERLLGRSTMATAGVVLETAID